MRRLDIGMSSYIGRFNDDHCGGGRHRVVFGHHLLDDDHTRVAHRLRLVAVDHTGVVRSVGLNVADLVFVAHKSVVNCPALDVAALEFVVHEVHHPRGVQRFDSL